MEILSKAIRIIDYENEKVYSRSVPDSFNEYIDELISHVKNNETVRQFNTSSRDTEVINCILQIANQQENNELFLEKVEVISNRLLKKEIHAQKRVSQMNTNVQKGSLIQALLYNEEKDELFYLLAKVEHSNFVDDFDLSFKSGFSKDKKAYWKTCLYNLSDLDSTVFYAKVYSNNVAKYWSVDFLELLEKLNDENNTSLAFKNIDTVLNQNIRKAYPRDHTLIRNSLILYFKNNEHIDYSKLIENVFENYTPLDIDLNKYTELIQKVVTLPEKHEFDLQFNSIPSIINAKIKKIYDINDGIQLKINDGIVNLSEKIKTQRQVDGKRFLIIETNNDDLYNRFTN